MRFSHPSSVAVVLSRPSCALIVGVVLWWKLSLRCRRSLCTRIYRIEVECENEALFTLVALFSAKIYISTEFSALNEIINYESEREKRAVYIRDCSMAIMSFSLNSTSFPFLSDDAALLSRECHHVCGGGDTLARAHSIHIRYPRRGKLIFPFSCHFSFPLLEREKKGERRKLSAADEIEARIIYILLAFCKYYETSHFALITCFRAVRVCLCRWRWQSNIIWLESIRATTSEFTGWGVGLRLLGKNLPNLNLQFRLHIIRKWLCCACEGRSGEEWKFETKSHLCENEIK